MADQNAGGDTSAADAEHDEGALRDAEEKMGLSHNENTD